MLVFYFFRLLFAAIADRMPFIYLIADFLLNNHSIAFIPTPILHAYTSYVPWGVARAAPFIRSSEIYLSPSPSALSLASCWGRLREEFVIVPSFLGSL